VNLPRTLDAERWKRVDDLLQSALEVALDQQEAFLRQQNAGRIVLCCRRSSRCCSPQAAGSFLESASIHAVNLELPGADEEQWRP
jgi:hypothetical protein